MPETGKFILGHRIQLIELEKLAENGNQYKNHHVNRHILARQDG